MPPNHTTRARPPAPRPPAGSWAAALLLAAGSGLAQDGAAQGASAAAPPPSQAPSTATLDDARTTLGKWIETQQILAKERKEWQQQKELLANRIELLKSEIARLEEKIAEAEGEAAVAAKALAGLTADNDKIKALATRLDGDATGLEDDVRKLVGVLPDSLQARVQRLVQRMPTKDTTTRVTTPERFQNVLTLLGEVNKANGEIAVESEVRTLPDGRRAEVQALYVGLGQAYYVNSGGLAGVGRPSAEGWRWEPRPAIARQVLAAVEILQGKQSPAFVPLPVKLQ